MLLLNLLKRRKILNACSFFKGFLNERIEQFVQTGCLMAYEYISLISDGFSHFVRTQCEILRIQRDIYN